MSRRMQGDPATSISTAPAVKAPAVIPPSTKVPVTVLVPTLNEAKNLPRCLDHLTWADQVLVIDSGSTDATRQVAESYGATVVDFRWDGKWPKKRNWALRNVAMKHPWVLMVDADEWIVPELAAEIAEAIRSESVAAYWINRRFMFMGRWIRHCGYYPSWNLRLLKRGCGEFERLTDVEDTGSGDNEVHEHIVVNGPVGYLKSDMLHFAYPTIHTFIEKHNRYSNWEAAVQFRGSAAHGGPGNPDVARRRWIKQLSRRLPMRPTLRFLYSYVLKRGFLDGRAGYTLCRLLGIYEYLSVAKYHELVWAQRHAVELGMPARTTRSAGDAATRLA